ncbi:hypothetical protein D3C71_2110810 [compost metagenome]
MQEQARGAGGGECSDHFLTDQARFPHAADRCAAFATEDQFNGTLEFAVQAFCQLADGLRLGAERFFGNWEVIHGKTIDP